MITKKTMLDLLKEANSNIDLLTDTGMGSAALILILESIDSYIEHRIESDKVLEGILKDIQNNTSEISMILGCINEVGITVNEGNKADNGIRGNSRRRGF